MEAQDSEAIESPVIGGAFAQHSAVSDLGLGQPAGIVGGHGPQQDIFRCAHELRRAITR